MEDSLHLLDKFPGANYTEKQAIKLRNIPNPDTRLLQTKSEIRKDTPKSHQIDLYPSQINLTSSYSQSTLAHK